MCGTEWILYIEKFVVFQNRKKTTKTTSVWKFQSHLLCWRQLSDIWNIFFKIFFSSKFFHAIYRWPNLNSLTKTKIVVCRQCFRHKQNCKPRISKKKQITLCSKFCKKNKKQKNWSNLARDQSENLFSILLDRFFSLIFFQEKCNVFSSFFPSFTPNVTDQLILERGKRKLLKTFFFSL